MDPKCMDDDVFTILVGNNMFTKMTIDINCFSV